MVTAPVESTVKGGGVCWLVGSRDIWKGGCCGGMETPSLGREVPGVEVRNPSGISSSSSYETDVPTNFCSSQEKSGCRGTG
jgi:hypothetical protein